MKKLLPALATGALFAAGADAQVTYFGAGCAGGSGLTPSISISGFPEVTSSFSVDISTGIPSTLTILVIGGSNTTWLGSPLPLDLGFVGLGGCDLNVSYDNTLTFIADAAGDVSLPVSGAGFAPGTTVYTQVFALDPSPTTLGGMSDGMEVVIGAGQGGPLVITEFMKDSGFISDTFGEYVEIYNPTGADIDIEGYTLADLDFDATVLDNGGLGIIVPAGGFAVDRRLVGKDPVERHGAERLPEGILQRPVEGLRKVLHRRRSLDRIGDAVFRGNVDADRHSVLGQQFLTGDVDRLAAKINDLHLDHPSDVPEGVHARLQRRGEFAIDIKQACLAFRHRMQAHRLRGEAGTADPAHQRRLDSQGLSDIDRHLRPRTRGRPDDETLIRLHDRMDTAIPLDDGHFGLAGDKDRQVTARDLRELVQESLFIVRAEFRSRQVVALDFEAAAPVGKQMLARLQDAPDLTLPQMEGTLVFHDQDPLEAQDSFDKAHHLQTPFVVLSHATVLSVLRFTSRFPDEWSRGPVAWSAAGIRERAGRRKRGSAPFENRALRRKRGPAVTFDRRRTMASNHRSAAPAGDNVLRFSAFRSPTPQFIEHRGRVLLFRAGPGFEPGTVRLQV